MLTKTKMLITKIEDEIVKKYLEVLIETQHKNFYDKLKKNPEKLDALSGVLNNKLFNYFKRNLNNEEEYDFFVKDGEEHINPTNQESYDFRCDNTQTLFMEAFWIVAKYSKCKIDDFTDENNYEMFKLFDKELFTGYVGKSIEEYGFKLII